MRKIFTFILALTACATSVFAQEAITVGNFQYYFNSSKRTAEVYASLVHSGNVVVPTTVEYNTVTYTVVGLSKRAFWYEDGITGFTLPDKLETIGEQAFAGCTSLTAIVLPASLKEIKTNAFQGDDNLAKITCYAIEPPVCGDYPFATYVGALYVPQGSIAKYKDASGWSGFAPDIYAIDDTAIDQVANGQITSGSAKKVICNGVIYIERNGELFNLTGAKLQ